LPFGGIGFEESLYQITTLLRGQLVARWEVQNSVDNFVLLLEGNISKDHHIQQVAKRPNCGWFAHVFSVNDPFGWRVNVRSIKIRIRRYF
jgi:hypothetical protein